ncbi:MAG: hypothetical protein LBR26_09965 [Prevotella sp.]|jgi:hypothetical protein|nr:hypothetical protein [Prevotella sp.]
MKTKLVISLLNIFLIMSVSGRLYAQVTIGSNIQPEKAALVDIKEKTDKTGGQTVDNGGLLLPRVNLERKHQLYPFIREKGYAPSNYNDPGYDPDIADPVYAAEKPVHIGLIVYNLTDDDDKELYPGLNQWDGKKWNCFQQKATTAQFEFECSTVQVLGQYGDGVALNSSNYIKVTLNVTRVGMYTISAAANPDNGYFYETSGVFYSPGIFSLTIPGTGQPVNHTQGSNLADPGDDTPDQFTLTSSGGGSDCNFTVNVRSTAVRPEFSIDCSATVVEGMYFEDTPLSSTPNPINGQSHRMKVTLENIPPSAYGSIAVLETNTVDGISFKGESVLTSSTQEIYLTGTGIPRGLNEKRFTITSNSESSFESCEAVVYMLVPRKRLMTLGNTSSYGYNAGMVDTRNPPNNLNAMLTDKNNFGYNQWSIVRFQGFNNISASSTSNFISSSNPDAWVDDQRDIVALETATWQNMSAATLESFLKGTNGHTKVDIFMIGYNTDYYRNSNAGDAARCQKLVDFVKSGGILMICSESTNSNGNFMNLLFNNPSPAIGSASGAGLGSNYTLGFNNGNMPPEMRPYYCRDDDPILRGPFEDILGRNWGEDASITMYVTNLPLDKVVIYSGAREIGNTSRPADGVTIFRHKEYPFVFVGDGGFNSSESRSYWDTLSDVCPFVLTSKMINGRTYTNYPTFRFRFGGLNNRVYNTIFTANAFAWCIYQAEEYRRTHK